MITLLGEQLYAVGMMCFIMFVPGWAIGRVLDIQLSVPKVLLPAAWFAFGLALWTVALSVALTFGWSWRYAFAMHAFGTIVFVIVARELHRRHAQAKPRGGDVATWTVLGIAGTVLLAAILRTRMAFDTVFHVGLIRRLEQLPHPHFDNLDRIVEAGVNPSYAVPTWQGAMSMVAGITGLDAATVVEAMAAFAVLIAACAAAGLGRMISGRWAGEIAGVAAYAWLRVFFPRRELEGDGVAYAALPGNVSLDTLLPLVLCAVLAVTAVGSAGPTRRRGAIALGIVASALLVLVHANYIVYVAIIGLGMIVWMLLTRTLRGERGKRVLRSTLMAGVPAALALVALLPVLNNLEQFGDPVARRIDYHLTGEGAWRIIRPGHLYDWFAAPGLFAMLALPFAAWRARGAARAMLAGGALAMFAVAMIPVLQHALDSTGSRTIGLRMPRPMGVLLAAALAIAIPALVDWMRVISHRVREARGVAVSRVVLCVPFVLVALISAVYGYPMARREPPSYGWDWPTVVAAVGLIVVLVLVMRARAGDVKDGSWFDQTDASPVPGGRRTTLALTGLSVIALGICLLPSGYVSLRRGAWQSRQVVASYQADDLGCMSGIQAELRTAKPGSLMLADPVTAYTAQAIGPVRVLADYKVWNGKTDSNREGKRIEELRDLFDARSSEDASAALGQLIDEYQPRYLLVADGDVEPPEGSTLGDFDARGLRELLSTSGSIELIAAGQGRPRPGATTDERAACNLSLYDVSRVQVQRVQVAREGVPQ